MANEPDNRKVVPGGDVVFEDGNTRADSLDGVMQTAAAGSVSVAADWELENMKHLAGEWVKVIGKSFTPAAQDVIPYVLQGKLEPSGSDKKMVRVNVAEEIRASILRPFLEAGFGTELAQTGIYEAMGLDSDMNTVQIATLIPYFPEFDEVMGLNDNFFSVRRNPYQPLLAFPIEARPFFTGAIRKGGYEGDITLLSAWHLPLTLKDVLAYAKEVNRLPKVKEYMDILNQVKRQQ